MEFKFYLNDIEVQQPVGFAELQLSIIRDETYHGVGFEASTGKLEFYGTGAAILKAAKAADGINAQVIFRAEVLCNAYQEEENAFTGRVNFGTYNENCGDDCTVSVAVEEDSCIVVLRNREDQDVDIDSLIAFDKATALTPYAAMGSSITLPAQEQLGLIEGSVAATQEINFSGALSGDGQIIFRPNYDAQVSNNLITGNLISNSPHELVPVPGWSEVYPTYISPIFLNEEKPACFGGELAYTFRMKGSFNITASGPASGEQLQSLKIVAATWDGNGTRYANSVILTEITLPYSGLVDGVTIAGTFDQTITTTTTLPPEQGIYFYLSFDVTSFFSTYVVNVFFEPETTASVSGNRICADSTTEYYMVHETLSRTVESITNNCARVKSSYYGRTESQPFAFAEDGCGGLRMLTSGLKIRKAEKDYFFTSFKKLIDGLNAIDNIGFGLEDDPDFAGKKIVRVEAVPYFYQDEVLLTLPAIPAASSQVQEGMYVSRALIGYKNWEVETINGLDEVNSTREYRTAFETLNNVRDLLSDLVAGAYPIELTRQQSFVDSGGADTRYDNNTFIICLNRAGYNTFAVEVGEVSDATDLYSPETKYNLRITPARNALRWYKSIANGYPNLYDSTNKLFFTSGTGNISACIKLLNNAYIDGCVDEAVRLCENQDLFITLFADIDRGMPIWKNETIDFEYPLSMADYKLIKANPYKKIRYQCGNGDFEDGYIKEVKYAPVDGTASFTLIKKY